jgi:hypothetical protein
MNVWLIVALVVGVFGALTGAYFDLEWRAFIRDVQNIAAGATVLAAALIAYRGATAKISADREDAQAARKRRRNAFRSALASELLTVGWEASRMRENATQFAGLPADTPRREMAHMRLHTPTLGISEWQDLATLGEEISGSYHRLIAQIGRINRLVDAVAQDAATMNDNPSVDDEVRKIARPFRDLAENCRQIAQHADRLAEDVRTSPD